jgi:hypothetical protein
MHKQFGTVVCIDIEATCWEKGMKPDDQVNEIIEIGLCFLDTFSLTISKPERLLVKPQQSTVSAFCTQLTSLTQQQLDTEGLSFPLACWLLKKSYRIDQYVWASFGAYEQKLFEQQCLDGLALYPFGPWHLNIQLLTGLGMCQGRWNYEPILNWPPWKNELQRTTFMNAGEETPTKRRWNQMSQRRSTNAAY